MKKHLNEPSSPHEKSKTKLFNYSCVHIRIKTNGVEAAGDENEKKVPPTESCERCNASFFPWRDVYKRLLPYTYYI